MTNLATTNLSTHESLVRVLGGSLLILTVLTNASPPWIALLAVYPVMSGIIKWDPLYGAYVYTRIKFRKWIHHKPQPTPCGTLNI